MRSISALTSAALCPSASRGRACAPRDRELGAPRRGDQQTQITRWCCKISHAGGLKIAGPSGIDASPLPLLRYLRPFSTDVTRAFTCSSSAMMASFKARNGSSGWGCTSSCGREIADAHLRLSSEKSPYSGSRVISALVIRRSPPSFVRTMGRKCRNGTAERSVLREQGNCAPEP